MILYQRASVGTIKSIWYLWCTVLSWRT